jgi:hypothetical protein
MEIQIKVPKWVHTDDEGICMLFAFLRRIAIEHDLTGKPLDVYGSDIRRIINREENNIHDVLMDHVDIGSCKIAKLSREHFVFYMKPIRTGTKIVKIKSHAAQLRWAYLMGCSNYNLVEPDSSSLNAEGRPAYTPMYRFDREVFNYTSRSGYKK